MLKGTPSIPSTELKLNVGCGASPTPGFVNLDNSLSALLAKVPFVDQVLMAVPLLGATQRTFVSRARREGIVWAKAGRLRYEAGTAALVYSSHMLEHLARDEAADFLKEALRVLRPGGWIRIAVPDLSKLARSYVDGALDADHFVEATLLASERPRGILQKLKFALTGPRHHLWMYDGTSLSRLLGEIGFRNVTSMPSGQTNIPEPGALDLSERVDESVYVEAEKPAGD